MLCAACVHPETHGMQQALTRRCVDHIAGSVAINSTIKLLNLLQANSSVPVALSNLPPVNPFPDNFRTQGLTIDCMPLLNQMRPGQLEEAWRRQFVRQPAQAFVAETLLRQEQPVTVLATGPLSNIAWALQQYPAAAAKISHIWWMGGALTVDGNVRGHPASDGAAEWNSFYDPAAVGVVWRSGVPLTIVPLDATNKVPISSDLLWSFGQMAGQFRFRNLAGMLWSPVVSWWSQTVMPAYFAWDTLTAACMIEAAEAAAAPAPAQPNSTGGGLQQPWLCSIQHGVAVTLELAGRRQGALRLVAAESPAAAAALSAAPAPPPMQYERRLLQQPGGQQDDEQRCAAVSGDGSHRPKLQALRPPPRCSGTTTSADGAGHAPSSSAGTSTAAADVLQTIMAEKAAGSAASIPAMAAHEPLSAQPAPLSTHHNTVAVSRSVSAVVDVDPEQFKQFLLQAFAQ